MSKLGDAAKAAVGSQSITLDDIVKDYDGVVTINSLGYVDYKGDKIPVFGFAEGPGLNFWGGCKKLRDLATSFEETLGNLKAINDELAVEGVRIKISPQSRTKGGNPFRPVSVLGTVKFGAGDEIHDAPEIDDETGEIIDDNPDDAPF